MAVGVIEKLKEVYIEKYQRELLSAGARTRSFGFDGRVETAPIPDCCQQVKEG